MYEHVALRKTGKDAFSLYLRAAEAGEPALRAFWRLGSVPGPFALPAHGRGEVFRDARV